MRYPDSMDCLGVDEFFQMKESTLLTMLGENAQAADLTAHKTAFAMHRDKSIITGFVVTSPNGEVGIIDKSAVRWLSQDEWWNFFHPKKH